MSNRYSREAGILMPISALPSPFGIGDFGANAHAFVDLLKKGGYSLWQILPLNPLGYGHSPYQPFSSFAIEESFVDLLDLQKRGFLAEVDSFHEKDTKVHYEEVKEFKDKLLFEAYEKAKAVEAEAIVAFRKSHPWVDDWSLFMMKKRKNNLRSWNEWSEKDKNDTLASLDEQERDKANFEAWLQMTLYREWKELRDYANHQGVRIIGDVPFYVGYDSVDVFAHKEMFLLEEDTYRPTKIAGVPPDYFSATGQRWGNPIYDWEKLKATKFAFLIDRLRYNAELYDIVRLDHFRAFDTYWVVEASCPTAVDGKWVEAPGYDFFDTFFKEVPNLDIIAEDLGDLRPEVLVLRDHYNFPGMNVVEFTFEAAEINHSQDVSSENMVAYIGTHDNAPFMGFYYDMDEKKQALWRKTLEEKGYTHNDIVYNVIEYTLGLNARYAILSMQDILGLGNEARLNVPSIIDDVNWTYRLVSYAPFESRLSRLRALNEKYHRVK